MDIEDKENMEDLEELQSDRKCHKSRLLSRSINRKEGRLRTYRRGSLSSLRRISRALIS